MYSNMSCGLKVNKESPDWYTSLMKVLKTIKGVSYTINVEEGTAIVTGRVNPRVILKTFKRFNKHAEVAWVRTGNYNNETGFGNGFRDQRYWNGGGNNYWPPSYGTAGAGYYGYYGPQFLHQPHGYWLTRSIY